MQLYKGEAQLLYGCAVLNLRDLPDHWKQWPCDGHTVTYSHAKIVMGAIALLCLSVIGFPTRAVAQFCRSCGDKHGHPHRPRAGRPLVRPPVRRRRCNAPVTHSPNVMHAHEARLGMQGCALGNCTATAGHPSVARRSQQAPSMCMQTRVSGRLAGGIYSCG